MACALEYITDGDVCVDVDADVCGRLGASQSGGRYGVDQLVVDCQPTTLVPLGAFIDGVCRLLSYRLLSYRPYL